MPNHPHVAVASLLAFYPLGSCELLCCVLTRMCFTHVRSADVQGDRRLCLDVLLCWQRLPSTFAVARNS